MRFLKTLLLTSLMALAVPAAAQQNPCNPCGKKAANPCGEKHMHDHGEMHEDGKAMVHESAEAVKPLQPGAHVPKVSLKTVKGESTKLADVLNGKPAVVVFYRGGWCPYCNTHLSELSQIRNTLNQQGVQLVAISPDMPEKLAETTKSEELSYTLLSDSDYSAMTAFGVAFGVDDETDKKLKGYGIDLVAWSGSDKKILPVPSVFVVDGEGVIKYTYANPDYKVRLSGEEVLKAVGSLKGEMMDKMEDGMKDKIKAKM